MKVLVTGAAGLLGSRFIEWILSDTDASVIAVDDLSGGYRENLPGEQLNRFSFYKMDVTDPEVESLFKNNGITHVVHMAAYAAEGLSPFIRKYNYTNNLLATANLINYSIKYDVERFLFTSTMAVYGNQPAPFSEDMKPDPIDPYGIAKYACEMDIRVAGEQHGLDWCIIRPHNVYGRHQNIWDAYRNVLGIWMYQLLNEEKVSIYGSGKQTRAFSDMADCNAPLWKALVDPKASKQIINLGGIKSYTINEAADVLFDVTGISKQENIIHHPERHEVEHAWSTWDKSVDLLGFEHNTDLSEGLQDMWAWAQRQPKRHRIVWNKYEIDKGLYPFWKQENLNNRKSEPSMSELLNKVTYSH